jgi:hypothetical protein
MKFRESTVTILTVYEESQTKEICEIISQGLGDILLAINDRFPGSAPGCTGTLNEVVDLEDSDEEAA